MRARDTYIETFHIIDKLFLNQSICLSVEDGEDLLHDIVCCLEGEVRLLLVIGELVLIEAWLRGVLIPECALEGSYKKQRNIPGD